MANSNPTVTSRTPAKASDDLGRRCEAAADRLQEQLESNHSATLEAETGLGWGQAGRLWIELHASNRADPGNLRAAAKALEWTRAKLASPVTSHGLLTGTAGVILLDRTACAMMKQDTRTRLADDRMAADALISVAVPSAGVDFVSGVSGIGAAATLALRGRPRDDVVHVALQVLRLHARATDASIWWQSERSFGKRPVGVEQGGWCDFGVAHGIAGIISFLELASQNYRTASEAAALMTPAAEMLRSATDPDLGVASFAWIEEGGSLAAARRRTKSAWCYGSLGVAAMLARRTSAWPSAPRTLNELSAAIMNEHATASENLSEYDLGLCHGLAGTAVVLRRIGTTLQSESHRHASDLHYNVLLDRATTVSDSFEQGLKPRCFAGRGQSELPESAHFSLLNGFWGVVAALRERAGSIHQRWSTVLGF